MCLRKKPECILLENHSYLDYPTFTRITSHPARVRKPKDKAKVEAGVQLIQRWILAANKPCRRKACHCPIDHSEEQNLPLDFFKDLPVFLNRAFDSRGLMTVWLVGSALATELLAGALCGAGKPHPPAVAFCARVASAGAALKKSAVNPTI